MASEVAIMQPTMIFRPSCLGGVGEFEGGGQPSGLVELDVDHVVERRQALEVTGAVAALVRAEGHGTGDAEEGLVVVGVERLLDQLDAEFGHARAPVDHHLRAPGFVGVDHEADIGHGGANRLHPVEVPCPAELELQERPATAPGFGCHGLGGVEADRVGDKRRSRRRQAQKFLDGAARWPSLPDPKGRSRWRFLQPRRA
jgi:hypothetical protein